MLIQLIAIDLVQGLLLLEESYMILQFRQMFLLQQDDILEVHRLLLLPLQYLEVLIEWLDLQLLLAKDVQNQLAQEEVLLLLRLDLLRDSLTQR